MPFLVFSGSHLNEINYPMNRVGSKGRHGSEFSNPQGLCALEDGGIAVADSNNSSVQIFDGDGNLDLLLGVRGRKPGNLQRPTGEVIGRGGHKTCSNILDCRNALLIIVYIE